MCIVTTCCCGCQLKTGCWSLSGIQIVVGILTLLAMLLLDGEEFEESEEIAYFILLGLTGSMSIIGGILMTIGLVLKSMWCLMVGAMLGYPAAVSWLLPLAWHIYLTIVVFAYAKEYSSTR